LADLAEAQGEPGRHSRVQNQGERRAMGKYTPYRKYSIFRHGCLRGEALHHARSDDAPPYFVMLIVGHVAVSFALALEETSAPPLWLTLLATMAIACVLTFELLPPVKGAIIALRWIF